MSTQITTAFVQQYRSTLYNLVQQKGSRLRSAVSTEMVTGESAYFEQLGATAAVERLTRHGDSPLMNTPHARRKVNMRDFEWGDLVDDQDKIRLLIDPASSYMQNAMWALGRKLDDVIIAAAFADAQTGKTGTTTVAFPAANVIAAAATGLTLTKLLDTKVILDAGETDPEEPRYIACAAKQVKDLLNTTEVKSSDYNTVKALAQGDINTFMGFTFIRTERLASTGTTRRCIAWVKSGLMLAMGADMKGNIAERADKSFATYVYASLSADATRMEEAKVVEIDCTET